MALHLLIGLPFCERPVMPEWAVALRNIVVPMNCTYGFAPTRGLPIDEARNALVEAALEHGAKYILFLDDDTAPPQDVVTKLTSVLDSNKDAMVCGGIYFSREKTPQPIVFKEEQGGPTWDWTFDEVFECSSLGTGCMMVKVEVFQHLEKPYFKTDTEHTMTDDIYFCRKVKAAGFKVFAHGGVIPIHWDVATKKHYVMSQDDPPVKRYRDKIAAQSAVGAGIPMQGFRVLDLPEQKSATA